MKKKSFIAVLSVFALATTFGAAACNKECEHAKTQIKSQGDYHYSECENCGTIIDIAPHVDEKNNETQANGADGKCDVCGADFVPDAPVTYEWKHDDNGHWQEIDGKKENYGGHVDLKGADGDSADGKCDTCEAAIKLSVAFDLNGKGQISPVSVEYGKKAEKPDDPAYFGYVFAGWYSDYELKNGFDFEQPITASTTVYAKWDEDETPGTGYNPGHAVVSELATQSFKTFGEASKLYFKLTVEEDGRYQVDLRGAASGKCTYVTDIDNDKYTVIDNGTTYFDLEEGDSVVVEVTRGDDVADDEVCAPYFTTVSNEKLGSAWKTGTYAAGEFELVLNANNLIYTYESNEDAVSFNYVGGKTNTLSFWYGNTQYTATLNKNGDIVLKRGSYAEGTFKYYVEENVVELSKFEGAYKLVNGQSSNLLEFGFDGEENIYIVEKSGTSQTKSTFKVGLGTTRFYKKSSTLIIDARYYVTLNLDADGDVTGVNISSSLSGSANNYTHDGHMVPVSVPVEIGEHFAGHRYEFLYSDGLEKIYWEYSGGRYNNEVVVKGYDFDTKTYTIANDKTQYKLNVEIGEDGKKTFYLYDLEGKLLDTLVPFVGYDYSHELPVADTDLEIGINDFLLNKYYLEVKEDGWYVFKSATSLSATLNIVKNENSLSGGTKVTLSESAVKLTAGTYVMFSIVGDHPDAVKISVNKDTDGSKAPAGTNASKPVELNGTGSFNSAVGFEDYVYYKYTASKPGVYLVTISDNGIKYYIGDSEDAAKATDTFTLTEGNLSVFLKVEVKGVDYSLLIEEDCTKGTALTPDEDGKGSLTVSGAYFLNDFDKIPYANSLTIKLNSEDKDETFKITVNGTEVEVPSYGFASADALAHGFVITLGEDQELEYTINYDSGAKQNPIEIKNAGSVSSSLDKKDQVKYFKITAPKAESKEDDEDADEGYNYIVTISGKGSELVNVIADSGEFDENGILKLAAGASVTIAVSCKDEATTQADEANEEDKEEEKFEAVIFNVNLFYDFTENPVGMNFDDFSAGDKTEDGTLAKYKAITVNAGKTKYHVDTTYGGNIIITGYSKFSVVNSNAENTATNGLGGVYTVTIPAGEDIYFELSSEKEQQLTFVFSCAAGTLFNPYEVKEFKKGVSDTFKVEAGSTTYFTLPAGTYAYTDNTDAELWITSEQTGSQLVKCDGLAFDIWGFETLQYVSNSAGSISFSYSVAPDYRGTYSGEGNKFVVNASSLKYNGKIYTLASQNFDEYTYTFELYGNNEAGKEVVKDTKTLALYGLGGGTYGEDNLTFIPVFVDEVEHVWSDEEGDFVKQTFTGKLNFSDEYEFDLTLTLTSGGIAVLSGNNRYENPPYGKSAIKFIDNPVNVTDNGDGTYSFPYYTTVTKANGGANGLGDGIITFTFAAGGKISFKYSNQFAYRHEMTPDKSFDPFANLVAIFTDAQWGSYVGSYTDSWGDKVALSLTLDKYGNGTFVYADGLSDSIVVSLNDDESCSFKYGNDLSAQFTFTEDGKVELTFNGNTATLTDNSMFSADVVGEYRGSYNSGWGAEPVILTFDKLGNGKFTYVSEYDITLKAKADGSYSFTYGQNVSATFTFTEDGTIALTFNSNNTTLTKKGAGGDVTVSGELKAGTYTGSVGYENITLVVNDDLSGTHSSSNGSANVNITLVDGKYTYEAEFTAWFKNTYTIFVNPDGTLSVSDSQNGSSGTLSLAAPKLPEGTYIGEDEDGWVSTLVVHADGKVDYSCLNNGNGAPPLTDLEVSYEDGVWIFNYYSRITLGDNGTLILNGTITLIPQKDPELPAGTYKGTNSEDGWIYTIKVNGDGTVDYSFAANEAGDGYQSFTGLKLSYDSDNEKWSFTYNYYSHGNITLGDNNTLILNDITLTLQIPELAANSYKGISDGTKYELVVNAGGTTGIYKIEGMDDEDIEFTFVDGSWMFEYWGDLITLTLNPDGTITIHDVTGDIVVSKDFEFDDDNDDGPHATLPAGTYTTSYEEDGTAYAYTLVVHDDNTVDYTFTMDDSDLINESGLDLVEADGKNDWTFVYNFNDHDVTVSLSLDGDGVITVNDTTLYLAS